MSINAIVALSIFVITFIFIMIEKTVHLHRTVIAMLGACIMIIAGTWMDFYHLKEAFSMVDLDTISLLLGMMMLVAILEKTGAFQYLAIKVARISKGNAFRLLLYLSVTTSILSMFLDSVTTVVLIAPVTLIITSMLGYSAIPFLMAEVLLANISGVATLIGDPPNIMIGSAVPGFTFMSFIAHTAPHIAIIWPVLFLVIYHAMCHFQHLHIGM